MTLRSSAQLQFALNTLQDTGLNTARSDVYEFQANLTPTPLSGGTQYWFSVVADTVNDPSFTFFWSRGNVGDTSALRGNIFEFGEYSPSTLGPYYFVLNDTFIPEPATGAMSLALLGLTFRRRRD